MVCSARCFPIKQNNVCPCFPLIDMKIPRVTHSQGRTNGHPSECQQVILPFPPSTLHSDLTRSCLVLLALSCMLFDLCQQTKNYLCEYPFMQQIDRMISAGINTHTKSPRSGKFSYSSYSPSSLLKIFVKPIPVPGGRLSLPSESAKRAEGSCRSTVSMLST
jgi:hypothetical protein